MLDNVILERELDPQACLWLMERLNEPTTPSVSYHVYSVKLLLIHIIDLASDKNNIIGLSVSPEHFNNPKSPL